jgi:hypothetical protein
VVEPMSDLPEGVIGFRIDGELEAWDYTDTLIPAVEAAAAAGDVRAVMVIANWAGFGKGAMKQDAKLGFGHLKSLKRMALVTDVDWMHHAMHLFGWAVPGELKVFPLAEQEPAIEWAAGDAD